jgi:hypothetical protein
MTLMKTQMKSKFIIIGLFVIGLFFYKKDVLAQTFNSSSYQIQWGNFNMTSGKKTSSTYILTDTVGQNAPGQYNSNGYVVKAGAQYAYDQVFPFSFKINTLNLSFGSLTPNIGSTVTNIITISTPTAHGYQIMAFENHPLNYFGTTTTIPDTTCDAGTCSETTSGVWTGSSAYGFGFNAIGIDTSGVVTGIGTSSIFTNSTYFRQFANRQNNEENQIIMCENNPVNQRSARITYRVLINPSQSAGTYQNSINFIAVPKY